MLSVGREFHGALGIDYAVFQGVISDLRVLRPPDTSREFTSLRVNCEVMPSDLDRFFKTMPVPVVKNGSPGATPVREIIDDDMSTNTQEWVQIMERFNCALIKVSIQPQD